MLGDPSFWVGASFVLFVLLLYKPLSTFINGALDARAKSIQGELDEALRLKEEAQELLSSYQRKQAEILIEAENIVKNAEAEAKKLSEAAEKKLEESANKRMESALQKINAYEEAVLQKIRSNAVDITIETSRALMQQELDKKIAKQLVDKSISDITKEFN